MPSSRLVPPLSLVTPVATYLTGEAEPTWTPLLGGRTNRLWRVRQGARASVVKLYDPSSATLLFPNDPEAEFAALSHLAPRGLAPEPVAQFDSPEGPVVIYRYIPGRAQDAALQDLARPLSRVHRADPMPRCRSLPSGSAAVIAQTDAILAQCRGRPSPLHNLRRAVLALPEIASTRSRLIHGDPVATNVVATPTGPVLIDWQCPAMGDPCEDLAIVLSPSMQESYRGEMLSEAEAAEFLTSYPDAALIKRYQQLAPHYHLRMAAYALWCAETGRSPDDTGMWHDLRAAESALSSAQA